MGLFCKGNLSFLKNQILCIKLTVLRNIPIVLSSIFMSLNLLFLNVKKDKGENSLIFFSKP